MTGTDAPTGPPADEALAWAPARDPEVSLVRRPDGAVLVDAAGVARLGLNETAAAVWEVCDGTTTVGEMVTAMVRMWAAPPSVLAADVAAVVRVLVADGSLLVAGVDAEVPEASGGADTA